MERKGDRVFAKCHFTSWIPPLHQQGRLCWISEPDKKEFVQSLWCMPMPTRWRSTTSDSNWERCDPFAEDLLTWREVSWGCLVPIIGGSWPSVGRDALILREWILPRIFWRGYILWVTANNEWPIPGLVRINLEHLSSHQSRLYTKHVSQPH